MTQETTEQPSDFIRDIVASDLASNKHETIVTRFPPEPNGYLHIGHAKAFCLSFGIAQENPGARCHLRFDDTNPEKEEARFASAIQEDVRWMGFDWGEHLYHASDCFEQLYAWAEYLIQEGKAYVDEQSGDEIRAGRGRLNADGVTEPGLDSPFRDRPSDESLDLFRKMRAGDFDDGKMVLRARIDMAAANLNLRDPVLYRILRATHPRTGDDWCIYPMYDFTHGQCDAIEGITHSLCSLEFENHRPLYEWFIENLPVPSQPRQIEFARLNLTHTVMSKRKLTRLVAEGLVSGWSDPRMPTLSGMRRRGYPASAIREFCQRIGISKAASTVDFALLEHCVRDELNRVAPRRMGVLDPIKVVITTLPEDHEESFEAPVLPGDPESGVRQIAFGREVWIDRDDFMLDPPKKFFRLGPGREVKLRHAYCITCDEVIQDSDGKVIELRCSHDLETRACLPTDRKVKGFLHWVSARHGNPTEIRILDHLFAAEDPEADGDFMDAVNPDSIKVIHAVVEPNTVDLPAETVVQFERLGYFCIDRFDSTADAPVLNQTIGLKSGWKPKPSNQPKKAKKSKKA
ncbi:MAG: glutamine--tRNA ligase/YqeY domain fusion protein [Planctomycetes bacterium]|jgi:glutaminyl-tRNA synthetase|nr:glutamine--tRNA ligase/YqeY domain fusion protein [Planctomycetota bacterium]MBT4560984.1 glutamine--tRNA ligase/YqeY domain fusion protein [Planctomycetota bacterium]